MRMTVAQIVADTIERLELSYPTLSKKEMARLADSKEKLEQGA